MSIRKATLSDTEALETLLAQILLVHHQARPDIFMTEGSKFTREELEAVLENPQTPVFVYEKDGRILGHLFTIIQEQKAPLTSHKTLFIEDLCVDENARGQKIGEQLYHFALDYAKEIGCYNLTLNVWNANVRALRFYERMGLTPQETRMEQILP